MAARTPPQSATGKVTKAERDQLRETLLAAGLSVRAVKDEMMRRWGYRPRQAWRFAHGWTQQSMAAAFNSRCDQTGSTAMSESALGAYERWPYSRRRSTDRPSLQVLRSLADLFHTTLDQVIDSEDLAHMPAEDRQILHQILRGADTANRVDEPTPVSATYRERDEPDTPDDSSKVVAMAAHESSEHAERAERRDVGNATLEQLRADIVRLSHGHMTDEPFPVFQEMRRVRNRIQVVLERKLWPRDQSELYFLLGALNGLMAGSARNLGNQPAAEELLRSGWVYAEAIDHRPLLAQLRLLLACGAYWQRPRQSLRLARNGLDYLPDGQIAAQLHLRYGLAAARLGEVEETRRAIAAAHEARAREHQDELLEIGGEFGMSRATQHFLAGEILLSIPDAETKAVAELQQALALYEAGPGPGEDHYFAYAISAGIDLATARLRTGDLEAADTSLQSLFALPANRRVDVVLRRLDRVRGALAAPRYQTEPLAADLDERIETFATESIVTDLGELPTAGPH